MNSQLLVANNLISDISGLNKAIAMSGAETGQDVQTYYDQREVKLEKLSEITDVSVAIQTDGQTNVYANGICVVSDSNFSELKIKTSVDAETKELTADLYAYDPIRKKETLIEPNTGKLATYMKHFNETLDANEQKDSALSVIRSIDILAGTLGEKVNALAVEGYGLDDTTLQERAIFAPQENGEAITAETLKLNPELRQDSRLLPIASEPGVSGNNDVALKIARLAQNAAFIDQQTANEYYAGFLGQFATYSNYANSNQSRLQLVSDQLENQRQSIVGVNEDEEAISLVKYQRVYESCARLVATLNEMLQVMVNLGK
jgi:flagellar hook-associated protein 1 FlgK